MSPRQQKAYEAIRACLLRPAAVAALVQTLDYEWLTDASQGTVADALRRSLLSFADEAARTLVGVMDELRHEEHELLRRAAMTVVEEVQLFGTHERIGALSDALKGTES